MCNITSRKFTLRAIPFARCGTWSSYLRAGQNSCRCSGWPAGPQPCPISGVYRTGRRRSARGLCLSRTWLSDLPGRPEAVARCGIPSSGILVGYAVPVRSSSILTAPFPPKGGPRGKWLTSISPGSGSAGCRSGSRPCIGRVGRHVRIIENRRVPGHVRRVNPVFLCSRSSPAPSVQECRGAGARGRRRAPSPISAEASSTISLRT